MTFASPLFSAIQSVVHRSDRKQPIVLHEPDFTSTDVWSYVKSCLDTAWVSSAGAWVNRFEELLSLHTGAKFAIAVSNGTNALRLGLHLVGVQSDEEVLVPSLSFVATANAVSHLGAIPHFVDIDSLNLGISSDFLDQYLSRICDIKNNNVYNKSTGRRIAAIVPVHVFGLAANIKKLREVSSKWRIPMIEDSAEALGTYFNGDHCGTFGDLGALSFNGNKLITTGGGGALLTNNEELAEKARHLSTTAKVSHPWEYFHDQIAWNDRMPNINAALGVAQLEHLNDILLLKRQLHSDYQLAFSDIADVELLHEMPGTTSNYWLNTIQFEHHSVSEALQARTDLLEECFQSKIYLRPAWIPLHTLPMYRNSPRSSLETTNNLSPRLLNLPSSPKLIKHHDS